MLFTTSNHSAFYPHSSPSIIQPSSISIVLSLFSLLLLPHGEVPQEHTHNPNFIAVSTSLALHDPATNHKYSSYTTAVIHTSS